MTEELIVQPSECVVGERVTITLVGLVGKTYTLIIRKLGKGGRVVLKRHLVL